MKLEFSREIFEKCSSIKCYESVSSETAGQTERNDKSKSHFLELHKCAKELSGLSARPCSRPHWAPCTCLSLLTVINFSDYMRGVKFID